MFIVLAATNFRLILENMIKYGLRFNPLTFLRTALTPSGAPVLRAAPRLRRPCVGGGLAVLLTSCLPYLRATTCRFGRMEGTM